MAAKKLHLIEKYLEQLVNSFLRDFYKRKNNKKALEILLKIAFPGSKVKSLSMNKRAKSLKTFLAVETLLNNDKEWKLFRKFCHTNTDLGTHIHTIICAMNQNEKTTDYYYMRFCHERGIQGPP